MLCCAVCVYVYRHLSLIESSVVRSGKQVSDARGRVSSLVSAGGYLVDLEIFAEDAISPESSTGRFYTDSRLAWDLDSAGIVTVGSVVRLAGRTKWNTTASAEYGKHEFRYYADEQVAEFSAAGHGQYEGQLTHGYAQYLLTRLSRLISTCLDSCRLVLKSYQSR